ncbi:hypothetical protein [Legionella nagasakiensis]|uniref:hypothetical protein n=1 Tax=Legionella nagasakiensis TaxID=535290 RepID=UPI001056C06F|nr:hypothetical protein [Legionella nagasakiensis]
MPAFFQKPSNALFEHAATLSDYQGKVPFNPDDPQHTTLLTDCSRSVREKLHGLQTIDKKIVIGFSLGVLAFGLSWILPLSIVAAGAFAYAAYQWGRRQQAYADYTQALENLVKCCIWTLGDVKQERVIDHPAVKEMIDTLAPVTSAQQLRDFIDDRVEDGFVERAEETKRNTELLDQHLNQEQADLYYKIYGYQQGGVLAILKGIGYAIKNGFKTLKEACFSSSQEESRASSPVM